mmetsp:Transcript_154322/g.474253  ORF Transcript_154322/g.474253 Transcript_154322/m.474253 type:complete len:175 (+) Transcript_154322:104-628(+)
MPMEGSSSWPEPPAKDGVQVDIVPNLDFLCLLGGAVPWYFGVAGGAPIATRRAGTVAVRAAGCALLAGSMILRKAAVDAFVERETPMAHKSRAEALVVGGPFAWSRNPMYVSTVGSLGSFGLLMNSWWGVGAAVPLAAYLQFHVIPAEERYLHRRFEGGFAEYCRTTPRWLLLL